PLMSHSLRVVFAGTPEFAAAALAAIHDAGFPVPLVLTQPDRPAGRGMKLQASPVKRYAVEHGLSVAQPPSLRRAGKFPAEASAKRGRGWSWKRLRSAAPAASSRPRRNPPKA